MNDTAPEKPERIAKVLARAGLCSRREAERWIADGRVTVNGDVLTTPAVTVTAADTVTVDGQALPKTQDTRLWLYHKPAGLITSHQDTQGRSTVFDTLPKELGRVISVGRLDLNSEGLLLLTNDGGLARTLELPATGWERRYRVRVYGEVKEEKLAALKDGVTISGVHYGSIIARIDRLQRVNSWLAIAIREGKNREIRKVLEHIGLTVNRLIRTGYGPFNLATLKPGEVAEVSGKLLREALGGDGTAKPKKEAPKKGWAKKAPPGRIAQRKTLAKKTGGKKPATRKAAPTRNPHRGKAPAKKPRQR
ncbi:MAG: pseudouridine synthase [Rhodospirillales bacterium]|nr:pseudouridine synthase [Rhodospirillales bacterium]